MIASTDSLNFLSFDASFIWASASLGKSSFLEFKKLGVIAAGTSSVGVVAVVVAA